MKGTEEARAIDACRSSSNKTVEGAVLFPVARSVALRSFRETIIYVAERRTRGDKDTEETAGLAFGRLGDRNKKGAYLFLYLCAVARDGGVSACKR